MRVWELFSRRQQKEGRAGQPEVYQYHDLPKPFRVQVVHILNSAIGVAQKVDPYGIESQPPSNAVWEKIYKIIIREMGVFSLTESHHSPDMQCCQFLQAADTKAALDLIEVAFRVVDVMVRHLQSRGWRTEQTADEAIEELNYRFRDHGIGFQYEGGQLTRVDSQLVHEEVVKPALSLLYEEGFAGASDEFLRAHEHYRKGRPKEAIAEALKAFESTMKTICDLRHWNYPANATAIPLIEIVIKNGLVPGELATHFGGLRAALESGLPTIRNKHGGHGQGQQPKDVPEHMAAYALHLAAANIVFLVQAYRVLRMGQ